MVKLLDNILSLLLKLNVVYRVTYCDAYKKISILSQSKSFAFPNKNVNKCIINHKTHFKIHFILQIFQYLQYNVRFKNTAESIID